MKIFSEKRALISDQFKNPEWIPDSGLDEAAPTASQRKCPIMQHL